MQIQTTDVFARDHGIKCLVYGRAGVGKTFLCGTAPRPLIISAESGLLSLAGKRIPFINVKSMEDVHNAFTICLQNTQHFDTICLDSLSEIAEVVLADAKSKTKDGRKAYGDLADEMNKLVRRFRDISGKHVVLTAKQGYMKDEFTGGIFTVPEFPGSMLTKNVPYLVDEVFHLNIGTNEEGKDFRYLLTSPTQMVDAKDRSGKLDTFEYPDLAHIFNKINGGPNGSIQL